MSARRGRTHGKTATYHAGCRCDECRAAIAAAMRAYLATRQPMAEDDPRHGTVNGYKNQRCRCDRCREAWVADVARRRQQRERNLPFAQHGRYSTYNNWRCRCVECTAAAAMYRRSQRKKQVAS